jgi:Glycosyltransferase family 87
LLTVTSKAAFGDLSIYAAGGAAVLHGVRLYQLRSAFQLRFTYPPFAAILFVPLAWLPVAAGQVLVAAATVLALPSPHTWPCACRRCRHGCAVTRPSTSRSPSPPPRSGWNRSGRT